MASNMHLHTTRHAHHRAQQLHPIHTQPVQAVRGVRCHLRPPRGVSEVEHHRRRPLMQAVTATQTEQAVAQGFAGVATSIEKTSFSSRKLYASILISAPIELVWGALTDYDNLASFIPSLVKNECLKRKSNGAVLMQVGQQDVAMGVKFSASCTLDCTEFLQGIPESLCSRDGNGSDGLLPYPRNSRPGVPCQDISFVLVDGDFKCFRGVWRMQPGPADASGKKSNSDTTLLCYSLYVQPQAWLPVALIQNRIEKEVTNNLKAVRKYAEQLYRQSGRRRSASPSSNGQQNGFTSDDGANFE